MKRHLERASPDTGRRSEMSPAQPRRLASLLTLPECIDASRESLLSTRGASFRSRPDAGRARLGWRLPHQDRRPGLLPLLRGQGECNFPGNPATFGLPTIQGVVALFDTEAGRHSRCSIRSRSRCCAPRRPVPSPPVPGTASAATSPSAAAEPDGVTPCPAACPSNHPCLAFDADPAGASRFASEMGSELGISVTATEDLAGAVAASDICVTCTRRAGR